ncbi:hypothetical protein AB0J38_07170 [Streptomyces sp. NPDC050095]|uniref:hypothetical protein n=1 Tax=Streptomyces sp. NPDC050095 TaxID=3155512 RepID=UPI003444CBBB
MVYAILATDLPRNQTFSGKAISDRHRIPHNGHCETTPAHHPHDPHHFPPLLLGTVIRRVTTGIQPQEYW